jgi:hypothetical protein
MTTTNPPRMPRGVLASAMFGLTAASGGWLLSGVGPVLTGSYTRLDQLSALLVGALAGAAVLGGRALRQRGAVATGLAAGTLLGGAGALCGVSVFAFLHGPVLPRTFLLERVMAWMFACGASALFLGAFVNAGRWHRSVESFLLGCGGGAIAGVVFMLPGASEAWQAIAFLCFGTAIGFAVAGPELWHAMATVQLLPPRGEEQGLLAMREWPLDEGAVLALGETQIACVKGRIALYPSAGGMVAAGRSIREPAFLITSGTIAAGRTRYHVQIATG